MSGLHGPLFSLTASGRLTRAFTLARRLAGPRWLLRGRPVDPQTEPQLSWRTMWQLAASLWHQLSAAEQAVWESAGTARGMTGYAWYMSQALRPNPGIYLPLAGGTMSGEIDMDDNAIGGLLDPTTADKAARKGYVDAHAGEPSLFSWRLLSRYHFTIPHAANTNRGLALDRLYAVPFYTPQAVTVTALTVNVNVGNAGAARLGIYEDDGDIYPGNLLLDAGVIDVTAAGNKAIVGLTQALAAKTLYWLVFISDATPTMRSIPDYASWALLGSSTPVATEAAGTYRVTQAYGALPATYPGGATPLTHHRPAIGAYLT